MNLSPRPALVQKIRPHYEDGRVKVLTGLRRSGKSSLLRLIAEDMREELDRPAEDFLFLDFEDFSLRGFTQPRILHKFVFETAKTAEKRLTVFLDEVDNVEHWEQVVAWLLDENVCDLFVTASNVDPFSEDGASLLGGRTVSFEVTPYSFREYRAVRKQVCPEASEEKLWRDYLLWGGMPDVANCADPADAGLRLIDIFRSILLRDVTRRLNLLNARALETTIAIRVERIGERISLEELSRRLLSERISVSAETLADYVRGASDAFLFAEIEGADTVGKARFRFRPRVYLADHGFRQALCLGLNERDPEPVLENIVRMELRRRGWEVHYGTKKERYADFIAEKTGKRLTLQVARFLDSPEAADRAFAPFYGLRDNFSNIVLSLDPVQRPRDGFRHENLRDWLLRDDPEEKGPR